MDAPVTIELRWSPMGRHYPSYFASSGPYDLTITAENILIIMNRHNRWTVHTEKFVTTPDAQRAAIAWLAAHESGRPL